MTRLALAWIAGGILVGLTGCSKGPPAGPRIDPAISGFIPADTVLLAGVRIEKIQKTPLYQKYAAQAGLPQLDRFIAETHINPANLWEVLYVSNGSRSALIGHGMFSDEGEPELQKRGDSRFKYKSFTMVGGDVSAILLVNQTVLAIGDTDQLKAMVDAHEKSAGPPPSMAALLARMPYTSQIWGAATLRIPNSALGLSGNLGNISKMLALLESGTVYLDLTKGLGGLIEGTSRSDQDAEQLASGLRAMIGFARLGAPANQPDLQKALDGLRPTVEGREVKLHIDEPEDAMEKLLDLAGGRKAPAK